MSLSSVVVSESESIAAGSANSLAAASCREISGVAEPDKSGSFLPVCWFAGIVGKLWPERRRAKMLRFLTGVRSDRTSRAWASGEYEPGASVLGAMLRSDDGARVLDAIMFGSPAAWWRELRRARMVCEAFDASRKQVEQLELALD